LRLVEEIRIGSTGGRGIMNKILARGAGGHEFAPLIPRNVG